MGPRQAGARTPGARTKPALPAVEHDPRLFQVLDQRRRHQLNQLPGALGWILRRPGQAGSHPAQHARVESWPFTAARAVESILHERLCFIERLQQIANLTQMI